MLEEETISFIEKPKFVSFLEIKSELNSKAPITEMTATKETGSLVLTSPKMNCACRFLIKKYLGLFETILKEKIK